MSTNRLIGAYPVIGIRPTIDESKGISGRTDHEYGQKRGGPV